MTVRTYFSPFYPSIESSGVEGSTLPGFSRTRLSSALADVGLVLNDNVITIDEKVRILIPRLQEVFLNYSNKITLIDQINGPEPDPLPDPPPVPIINKLPLVTAYNAFNTYLLSLTPLWDNIAENTALIEGPTPAPTVEVPEPEPIPGRLYFLSLFEEFVNQLYLIDIELNNVYIDNIAALANDNLLTPSEKLSVSLEYERLVLEKDDLISQAIEYNINYVELEDAFDALSYVPNLVLDRTTSSSINGTQLIQDFKTYYLAAKDIKETIRSANITTGITGYLTNENATVEADSQENVSPQALESAGGQFILLSGSTVVGATFEVESETGVNIDINPTTGVYSVTSLTSRVGNAVLRATYNDVVIRKTYTISKSIPGSDGQSAKLLVVISSAQTFTFRGSQATPSDQVITLTAQKQNADSDTVIWSLTDADGVPQSVTYLTDLGPLSKSINISNFNAARNSTNGIVVSVTLQNTTITDKISIVRVSDGQDGATLYTWVAYANNATGTLDFTTGESFSGGIERRYIGIANNETQAQESLNPEDYVWSLIRGNDGVPGDPGADGQTTYTWFAYANNPTGTLDFTTQESTFGGIERSYIGIAPNKLTAQESNNPADYVWSRIRGSDGVDGVDGTDGIPGPPGPSGQTLYTWIAYANNADGTSGFTTNGALGRPYIGIANNQLSETEGTNPATYRWSLIRGTDGVPGTPGADGQTTYTWFAYANNITGTLDFTTGAPGTRAFIGIAPNRLTDQESNNPADYTWSRLTGETGPQGPTGPAGPAGTPGRSAIVYQQENEPTSGMVTNDTWLQPSTRIWRRYTGSNWVRILGEISTLDIINAQHISVVNIAAISANLGTFITNGPSGSTRITGSVIEVFDGQNATGTRRVRLGVW